MSPQSKERKAVKYHRAKVREGVLDVQGHLRALHTMIEGGNEALQADILAACTVLESWLTAWEVIALKL